MFNKNKSYFITGTLSCPSNKTRADVFSHEISQTGANYLYIINDFVPQFCNT